MKIVLFFLSIVLSLAGLGQNLVPNPSFEEVNRIPCTIYVTNISETKKVFNSIFKDWRVPTYATTDAYSLLSDKTCLTYPSREFTGAPPPKDGNNMVGLYTTELSGNNYREYISVNLKKKLIPGQRYLCGFYTSLSTRNSFTTNSIGMYFSTDTVTHPYNDIFVFSLKYRPQITFDLVSNSKDWRLFYGHFSAEQELEYLAVGNFRDNSLDNAYCFLDSIFVEPIEKLIIPNVITPNGDRYNEKFEITGLKLGRWGLKVVNRWGQLVYYSTSYVGDWSGEGLSSGIYFYEVFHKYVNIVYKGSLTIIH